MLYLVLGLPLGIFYFTFLVTAISVGAGTLIIWVGVPILAATLIAWRWFGAFERVLAAALLGQRIEAPPSPVEPGMRLWPRSKALLTDNYTWRSFGWLLLRFLLGIAGFVLVVVLVSVTVSLLAAPIVFTFPQDWRPFTAFGWLADHLAPVVWLLPLLGVVAAGASGQLILGFGRLHGLMARALLGPSGEQQRARLQRRTQVLEERTQLAHELHDSVGHTLTMMVVQAGAGRHVFERDPDFAREALANIEGSGRRALGELDRILGLLRDDESVERAPQPSLGLLPGLVDEINAAGADVTLEVEGDTSGVPSEVSRSAYRIVQEALTNVVKHAGPVPTRAVVHRAAGALELEVRNDAPAAPPALTENAGGRGLTGIRERVAMLGGSVEAGPRPGGGFRVWARIPIE